jgi:hypothetical protein
MYHQFNVQHFYILPQSLFKCFVFTWEQTAIILFNALKYHTFPFVFVTSIQKMENKYISEFT